MGRPQDSQRMQYFEDFTRGGDDADWEAPVGPRVADYSTAAAPGGVSMTRALPRPPALPPRLPFAAMHDTASLGSRPRSAAASRRTAGGGPDRGAATLGAASRSAAVLAAYQASIVGGPDRYGAGAEVSGAPTVARGTHGRGSAAHAHVVKSRRIARERERLVRTHAAAKTRKGLHFDESHT